MKLTPSILNSYLYSKNINNYNQLIKQCKGEKVEFSQEIIRGLKIEKEVYDKILYNKYASDPAEQLYKCLSRFTDFNNILIQEKKKILDNNDIYSGIADIILSNAIVDLKTTKKYNLNKNLFKDTLQHLFYYKLFKMPIFYYIIWSSTTNLVSVEKYIVDDKQLDRLYNVVKEFKQWLINNNLYEIYNNTFR